MALTSSRPRSSLNDENSLPAGKIQPSGAQGTGRAGLKQQLSTTASERRILSDISNAKNLSSFGTPKPSPKPGFSAHKISEAFSQTKFAGFPQPPSSQKPPASATRIPLRTIVNESRLGSSLPGVEQGQKAKAQEPKKKSGFKVRLTDEQLRQCEEWAKEDLPVEQTHFIGEDMEKLRELRMEAEVEEIVAMTMNYKPAGRFLPSSKPQTASYTEPIYFEDGRLKPDIPSDSFDEDIEEPSFTVSVDALEVEAENPMWEPELMALASKSDDFRFPSIPEDWGLVPDEIDRSAQQD